MAPAPALLDVLHGSVEHAVLDGSLILHAAVERASADGAAGLELLPLFTSPLNVPPLMAKPLNMFTDSLNVPSSIAPLLIPMTMQSNVPPVMVPEEVLTYDFVGSFGSLLKVPPAMMPAFPMLAVNAPP